MSFDETEESACRLSVSVLSERWKEPGWPKAKRFVFKEKQRRKNHVIDLTSFFPVIAGYGNNVSCVPPFQHI